MRGRADVGRRGAGGGQRPQPGEVAGAEACAEQPHQRAVDVGHRHQPALQCLAVGAGQSCGVGKGGAGAFVVDPGAQGGGHGAGRVGCVVVVGADVGDRVAVGDHVAVEAPGAAQRVLQQQLAGAGRLAVDPVVGAHHRAGATFDHRGAERRQVGVLKVAARDVDVGVVAGGFRAAVHGVVLGRGDHVQPLRMIALHALDVGHADPRGQERILAIGFLAAPPARVAEDVEVRRPGVEPGADASGAPGLPRQRVQAAHLGADHRRHALDQVFVEAGGQADRFGEIGGGQGAERAVQRFGPPVVGRHVQARDRRRGVEQLRQLLLGGHPRDQRGGQRVGVVRGLCGLRARRGQDLGAGQCPGRRHGQCQQRTCGRCVPATRCLLHCRLRCGPACLRRPPARGWHGHAEGGAKAPMRVLAMVACQRRMRRRSPITIHARGLPIRICLPACRRGPVRVDEQPSPGRARPSGDSVCRSVQ